MIHKILFLGLKENVSEEEMRQNMEELRATQDDATRKEIMNLEKIKELEEEIKRLCINERMIE